MNISATFLLSIMTEEWESPTTISERAKSMGHNISYNKVGMMLRPLVGQMGVERRYVGSSWRVMYRRIDVSES